ncbi:flavoprotein-like protein [Podospora conica]|nr:flavoprotein-like protein [Schizothecium conicum]
MSKSIAIITLSTRTPRAGPHVAALVKSILEPDAAAADITLTPYDEAVIPGMVDPTKPDAPVFAHAHSLAWSAEVRRHAAYVLVLNEYNYSLPGAAKNAIDYLHHEWKGKPVAVVTYGIQGGSFASEQAAHVLGKMGLKVAPTRPQLQFKGGLGPETFAAMLEGKVGGEQLELWRGEKGGEVRGALGEVLGLLGEGESV